MNFPVLWTSSQCTDASRPVGFIVGTEAESENNKVIQIRPGVQKVMTRPQVRKPGNQAGLDALHIFLLDTFPREVHSVSWLPGNLGVRTDTQHIKSHSPVSSKCGMLNVVKRWHMVKDFFLFQLISYLRCALEKYNYRLKPMMSHIHCFEQG